jgi:hypothetical protein
MSLLKTPMDTTSKWGGYGASLFSIVCFGEGMAYAITQGELPDWFAIVTGSSFLLGTISGTVCLGAALVDYFQRRRNSQSGGDDEVAEDTA